jgi:hypothetical protein
LDLNDLISVNFTGTVWRGNQKVGNSSPPRARHVSLLNQALTPIPRTGSELIFGPFGPTTTAVRQNDIAG